MKQYFMTTERLGFSVWEKDDLPLAQKLWGDPKVTALICASGVFSADDIKNRLEAEIANNEKYGIQYWPVFELETGELAGCCGLRPKSDGVFEIGFHLRPDFWGKEIAVEAAGAVLDRAFGKLGAASVFAGHNPKNVRSARVMKKLGFRYIGDEFYAPTGLYHPSYMITQEERQSSLRKTSL